MQLDGLVRMAVKHIDNLKKLKDAAGKPLESLPWWGEVFGKVHVSGPGENSNRSYSFNEKGIVVHDPLGNKTKAEAQMQYGKPLPGAVRL